MTATRQCTGCEEVSCPLSDRLDHIFNNEVVNATDQYYCPGDVPMVEDKKEGLRLVEAYGKMKDQIREEIESIKRRALDAAEKAVKDEFGAGHTARRAQAAIRKLKNCKTCGGALHTVNVGPVIQMPDGRYGRRTDGIKECKDCCL